MSRQVYYIYTNKITTAINQYYTVLYRKYIVQQYNTSYSIIQAAQKYMTFLKNN